MRVHRNFILSRPKMRSEAANHRWGIVSEATHGLIQMRAFESIKFTAFPKSAHNSHYSFSVLMAVLLIMTANAFIAWSTCHSLLTKLILYLSINGRNSLIIREKSNIANMRYLPLCQNCTNCCMYKIQSTNNFIILSYIPSSILFLFSLPKKWQTKLYYFSKPYQLVKKIKLSKCEFFE